MALVVGEAEVIIVANTAGLEASLLAETDPALTSLETKSRKAGQDAGSALSGGLSSGAKNIGKDTENDLKASTSRMEGVVNDFSHKASNSLQSLGIPASLTTGSSLIKIGFAGAAAAAVDLGVKMQSADASIAATSGDTIAQATAIGNAFLNTGGQIEYSGAEMARAFAPVAGQLKEVNGGALNAAQSLAFMRTATDLATASGQDLTTTTSTLATTLQAFQMPVADAAQASTVLFNVSNATGQSMDTVGAALDRVRSKLGATSPPLAELGTLMLDMTNNGITGRAAITGLNTAMTGLVGAATGTTKANLLANATLKQYGIEALQTNGQLTPLSTIIDKLAPKYATMKQAQQLQTSTLIFGAAAAKQMTQVIDAGSASYQKASNTINNANSVTEAATKKNQTLSGQIKILRSDVVDIATKFGEVLVPALTMVTKAILPVIDDVVSFIGWLTKGSEPAIAVASVLTAIVAPALVSTGVTAVSSAATTIGAFISEGLAATVNAAKTVAAKLTEDVSFRSTAATAVVADAAVSSAEEEKTAVVETSSSAIEIAMQTLADAIMAAAATITAANTEVEGSFGLVASTAATSAVETEASIEALTGTVVESDATIVAANAAAGESFLAMLGPIGLVAAAGVAAYEITTKLLDSIFGRKSLGPLVQYASTGQGQEAAQIAQQEKLDDIKSGTVLSGASTEYILSQINKRTGSNYTYGKSSSTSTTSDSLKQLEDQFKAQSEKVGSGGGNASAKLDPAELQLQSQGIAAMNSEVVAIHSKNLVKLTTDVDAAHKTKLDDLVTKLDATHNTKLTALGAKLETDFTKMETSKNAIITTNSKNASTALNAQLSLTTSTSLSTLNTQLDATHNAALITLEGELNATHNKNLEALSAQLVQVHKEALANQTAQILQQNAANFNKEAGGIAAIIADQETVKEDIANMAGLSGQALTVAQAQLALDQQKLVDAQQEGSLQSQIDAAGADTQTGKALQTQLDNFEGQAQITEANLAASASWQTTLNTIATNAAAAAAAAPAPVATSTLTDSSTTSLASTLPPTQITIQQGAVVINPAPGNDATSLSMTEGYVNTALQQLLNELNAGNSPAGVSA